MAAVFPFVSRDVISLFMLQEENTNFLIISLFLLPKVKQSPAVRSHSAGLSSNSTES